MRLWVALFGVLLTVPLVVVLALGLQHDPKKIDSPLVGRLAPSFTLVDLEGRSVTLEELRGQPVVLNFWATWCQPCVLEHPTLRAAARRYAGRVHFLGVIYHDQPEFIEEFVERRGAWGPSLIDPGSRVAIVYGVFGAPETFLIDAEGQVVEKVTGALAPDALSLWLEELLAR